MQDPLLLAVIVAGTVLCWLLYKLWWLYRWYLAKSSPFPENWLTIVKQAVPFYDVMEKSQQQELLQHINRFLFFKKFVGCAGLQVTEEMRLTVAACACLLLLNRPSNGFKQVRWILLYPAEFVVRHTVRDAAGVVSRGRGVLAGEAWQNGRIILAWDSVKRGVFDFNDGRNVVLHEFAHQLDGESGSMNGAPLLYSKGAYGSWATIMSREYESLVRHAYFGKKSVLDEYGATNPAEFFAVATESFFEEPQALKEEHPELYQQLADYYHTDPLVWHKAWQKPAREKSSKASVAE